MKTSFSALRTPAMRACSGFLLAPIAGTLTSVVWNLSEIYHHGWPFTEFYLKYFASQLIYDAYSIAICIGAPVYLCIRSKTNNSLATSILFGGMIAALPQFVVLTAVNVESENVARWAEMMRYGVLPVAVCGGVAGAVFWLIVQERSAATMTP